MYYFLFVFTGCLVKSFYYDIDFLTDEMEFVSVKNSKRYVLTYIHAYNKIHRYLEYLHMLRWIGMYMLIRLHMYVCMYIPSIFNYFGTVHREPFIALCHTSSVFVLACVHSVPLHIYHPRHFPLLRCNWDHLLAYQLISAWNGRDRPKNTTH